MINSPTYFNQPSPTDDTNPSICDGKMIDVKVTETDLPFFFEPLHDVNFINAHARASIEQLGESVDDDPVRPAGHGAEAGAGDLHQRDDRRQPRVRGARHVREGRRPDAVQQRRLRRVPAQPAPREHRRRGRRRPDRTGAELDDVRRRDTSSATTTARPTGCCTSAGTWTQTDAEPSEQHRAAGRARRHAHERHLQRRVLHRERRVDVQRRDPGRSRLPGRRLPNPGPRHSRRRRLRRRRRHDYPLDLRPRRATCWESAARCPADRAERRPGERSTSGSSSRTATSAATTKNDECPSRTTCEQTFTQVQRPFSADGDRSGPIEVAQVSEGATFNVNNLERGTTHDLAVTIGVRGLQNATSLNEPKQFLRRNDSQQTHSLDCKPPANRFDQVSSAAPAPTSSTRRPTARAPSPSIRRIASTPRPARRQSDHGGAQQAHQRRQRQHVHPARTAGRRRRA